MPVYDINELKRNVSWFITAETKQDEEDILTSDDDFEPDIDEDSGSGNDIESDSDEEPGSDDGQESDADSKNVEFRQSEGDQEKDDDQGNEADCDSDEESESVEKPNSDDDDCAESVPGNRDEVISDAELDDLIDPYLDDLRPEQRTYSALDTQTKVRFSSSQRDEERMTDCTLPTYRKSIGSTLPTDGLHISIAKNVGWNLPTFSRRRRLAHPKKRTRRSRFNEWFCYLGRSCKVA